MNQEAYRFANDSKERISFQIEFYNNFQTFLFNSFKVQGLLFRSERIKEILEIISNLLYFVYICKYPFKTLLYIKNKYEQVFQNFIN